MSKFSFSLLAAFIAVLVATEAKAWFDFRNKTSQTVWVAFQWHAPHCGEPGKHWNTKGWWRLEPGETKTVFADDLQTSNKYFYFYAEGSAGAVWGGAFQTCVPITKFEWCLDTCNAASQTRILGFREAYIGSNNHFTIDLIE